MATLIGDCVEAVLDAVLEDEVTAVVVGIPLLVVFFIPALFVWIWWPRKKPVGFRP